VDWRVEPREPRERSLSALFPYPMSHPFQLKAASNSHCAAQAAMKIESTILGAR